VGIEANRPRCTVKRLEGAPRVAWNLLEGEQGSLGVPHHPPLHLAVPPRGRAHRAGDALRENASLGATEGHRAVAAVGQGTEERTQPAMVGIGPGVGQGGRQGRLAGAGQGDRDGLVVEAVGAIEEREGLLSACLRG
jgi:hypothetical protein